MYFNLKDEIEKISEDPRQPEANILHVRVCDGCILCNFSFPVLELELGQESTPRPVHIYCYGMWEDNFIPRLYEIWDLFLGSMYHKTSKADAPTFSERARELISLHGDWYVGEYFSYMRIGGSNTVHILPKIVLDYIVLQEFSF